MKNIIWSCPGAHVEPKASGRQMLTTAPPSLISKKTCSRVRGRRIGNDCFRASTKSSFGRFPGPPFGKLLYHSLHTGSVCMGHFLREPLYGSLYMGASAWEGAFIQEIIMGIRKGVIHGNITRIISGVLPRILPRIVSITYQD